MHEYANAECLYTVILEFDGVNSVSQVRAADQDAAFRIWQEGLRVPSRYALTEEQARAVISALEPVDADDSLVLLEGMRNAWCQTGSAGGKHVVVNVIRTSVDHGDR